jgi:hypothetical protein
MKLGGGNPKCPNCGKSVYHAERVHAVGKYWYACGRRGYNWCSCPVSSVRALLLCALCFLRCSPSSPTQCAPSPCPSSSCDVCVGVVYRLCSFLCTDSFLATSSLSPHRHKFCLKCIKCETRIEKGKELGRNFFSVVLVVAVVCMCVFCLFLAVSVLGCSTSSSGWFRIICSPPLTLATFSSSCCALSLSLLSLSLFPTQITTASLTASVCIEFSLSLRPDVCLLIRQLTLCLVCTLRVF